MSKHGNSTLIIVYKNIMNQIRQIFNRIHKNLKSIGLEADRLNIEQLKSYSDYKFKNKQKFESQQRRYIQMWIYRILVIYIFIYLFFLFILIISQIRLKFILFIGGIMVLVAVAMTLIALLIIEFIKHPMISYIFGVPVLAISLTYAICSSRQLSKATLLTYFIVCLILYSLFILILPINIFRKITPQIAFLPVISSIAVQLATNYRDIIFNYTMNGISDKVSNSFFKNDFTSLRSRADLIKCVYEMYIYLFVERKTNMFYNQLAELCGGITLTFLIGGVIITIRTHHLDLKANKKWKNIIYSSSIRYSDLIECAYIGGRNYENLILNNVNFIKVIKDEEKDISKEKSWKEKIKEKFTKELV